MDRSFGEKINVRLSEAQPQKFTRNLSRTFDQLCAFNTCTAPMVWADSRVWHLFTYMQRPKIMDKVFKPISTLPLNHVSFSSDDHYWWFYYWLFELQFYMNIFVCRSHPPSVISYSCFWMKIKYEESLSKCHEMVIKTKANRIRTLRKNYIMCATV